MKLHLLQELLELNQAFERVLSGLTRMESVRCFHRESIHCARAEVESARADANEQFFDNFEEIVGKDAEWAYGFLQQYQRKTEAPEDLYLEIKKREETRKTKGLPLRFTILPNWVLHDEERYDEERARERKRSAKKRRNPARKRKT